MCCLTILQLLTMAMLFCSSPPIVHGTTECYVVPTQYKGIPCPLVSPATPSIIMPAIYPTIYTFSDVVVRLPPGNHILNQSFYIRNKRNLHLSSFKPAVSLSMGGVSIHCTSEESNFHFQHTSNVTIVGYFLLSPWVGLGLAL